MGFGLTLILNDDYSVESPSFIAGYNDVSVRQQCIFDDRTVEQGYICCDVDIPSELPYNIDQNELDSWSITCKVHGMYEPLNSIVTLTQEVNGVNYTLGYLSITWEKTYQPGSDAYPYWPPYCEETEWTGSFHLIGTDAILPHSSYYPELKGEDCNFVGEINKGLNLNKPVFILINTTWEGCTTFNVICESEHTVQQGYIDCSWVIPSELPYNIELSDLAGWSATCDVYGQYEIIGKSMVKLYQWVNGHHIFLGELRVKWDHTVDPLNYCAPDIWVGSFELAPCDNAITPYSSYYPSICPDCYMEFGTPGDLLPDYKPVDINVQTTWEGCEEFDVILIHKNLFLKYPTLK